MRILGRAEVVLSDEELARCHEMAVARNDRESGQNPRAERGGVGGVEAHEVGVVGEVGFAIYLGLGMEAVQVFHRRGDGGIDFDLDTEGAVLAMRGSLIGALSGTWQVKCSRSPSLALRVYKDERTRAAYYLKAAWRLPRTVILVGYVGREELLARPLVERRYFASKTETALCREVWESQLQKLPRVPAAELSRIAQPPPKRLGWPPAGGVGLS